MQGYLILKFIFIEVKYLGNLKCWYLFKNKKKNKKKKKKEEKITLGYYKRKELKQKQKSLRCNFYI